MPLRGTPLLLWIWQRNPASKKTKLRSASERHHYLYLAVQSADNTDSALCTGAILLFSTGFP